MSNQFGQSILLDAFIDAVDSSNRYQVTVRWVALSFKILHILRLI